MAKPKRRVAVIGAGPAGAIATDALVKEQAFDTIRVFERRKAVGGTWLYDPNLKPGIPSLKALVEQKAVVPSQIPPTFPCEIPRDETSNSHQARYWDSGAHEHLHSNLPPVVMCFSQEPIKEIVSERSLAQYGPDSPFRHRELIREWIEAVFTRGKTSDLVQFNTTVELAEYDQKSEEWILTLRREQPGKKTDYWWQEKFDALVVASGHFYLPYIPDIQGLLGFDEKFPGRIQHSKHYRSVEDYRDKRVVVVGGSISAFDAVHDIRLISKLPVISSLRKPNPLFTEAAFTHPDVTVKPQIDSFSPQSGRITFSDGSSVDDVDIVLFATGYDFSVPFLPDLKGVNKRIPGLYQHVFKIDNPSLAFIGMVTGGFGIRIYEWQAVAVARVLAGHAKLPSRDEMYKWEQDRLALKGEGAPFWTLMPDFEEHFEAYRGLAGDPAEGTLGRVLPKYDPAWGEEFWKFVRKRIEWWQEAAAKDAARRQVFPESEHLSRLGHQE